MVEGFLGFVKQGRPQASQTLFYLTPQPKKSRRIEGILGGLVSEVARILEVCKQSRKPAQHQIHQLYGFLFILHYYPQ